MCVYDCVIAGTTPEAIYVQDIDKFEMILTALEYETGEQLESETESMSQQTNGHRHL